MLQEIKRPLFMKKHKELEDLMYNFEMDASNNYKDNARDWYKQLEKLWEQVSSDGSLNQKQLDYYGARMAYYRDQMKGYHH